MSSPDAKLHDPAWKVWTNPIFRRYCRSRLRPRALGVVVLLDLLVAGFIVAMATSIGGHVEFTLADMARSAVSPLLVFQCLILFGLGTAQVSGGMISERDEGVIDYQRLIPMAPLAKTLGYLFGLPVREYVMFAGTLPFTIWALAVGQVSWQVWVPLYGVVFSSTILYHLTALVTGTVVRNRRSAFLISIGLVFALYTVIPQVAKFGLVFFKYLTVRPVFMESLPGIMPGEIGAAIEIAQRFAPSVKFFNLGFSETVFTLFTQTGLALTFCLMLCRKWRNDELHLLGKRWATGLFVWIHILLLGNALPLIEPGLLFPSRQFVQLADVPRTVGSGEGALAEAQTGGEAVVDDEVAAALPEAVDVASAAAAVWKPPIEEAAIMSGLYGLVTLLLICILARIITPSVDHQKKGWRRAHQQGRRREPVTSDAASSWPYVVAMAVSGGLAWFHFTRSLFESDWFPGREVGGPVALACIGVLLAGGLLMQTLLEGRGSRLLGLVAILVGIVPLMVGTVLVTIGGGLDLVGIWTYPISPLVMPFYGALSLLESTELPSGMAGMQPAFRFWLIAGLIAALLLSLRLRKRHRERAAAAAAAMGADQGADQGA